MERRHDRRFPRRLSVRFWRRGDPKGGIGFTTDISASGMFLGTGATLDRGERLRLEVAERSGSFVVEGQVVRLQRVAVTLRQIQQPGVGIRFLSVAELFQEILPGAVALEGSGYQAQREAAIPPAAPPPSAAPAVEEPRETPKRREQQGQVAEVTTDGRLVVEIKNLEELRRIFSRDIAHGGLFVLTASPLPLNTTLELEIHLPQPLGQVVTARGRVIHSFPGSGKEPGNLLSGMGVAFAEADTLRKTLQDLLDQYDG